MCLRAVFWANGFNNKCFLFEDVVLMKYSPTFNGNTGKDLSIFTYTRVRMYIMEDC